MQDLLGIFNGLDSTTYAGYNKIATDMTNAIDQNAKQDLIESQKINAEQQKNTDLT